MNDISVFSNWVFVEDCNLNKIITYSSSKNKEYDIENVTTESCVCLTPPEKENFQSPPVIEIKSKNLINEINILSEGSLIEIFGDHNEYLFSSTSNFIDDWDGMAVYHNKIILPDISNCKLKFARTKDKKRIWIYNIELTVVRSEESSEEIFNVENVNKLINNSNHKISEKAEKFKHLFEAYTKNLSQLKNLSKQSVNLQTLIHMINKDINFQCKDSLLDVNASNFSTVVSTLNTSNEKFKNDIINKNLLVSLDCDTVEYLKSYIDEKCNEIKEDILKSIEVKFKRFLEENNAKLEKIINLLDLMKT